MKTLKDLIAAMPDQCESSEEAAILRSWWVAAEPIIRKSSPQIATEHNHLSQIAYPVDMFSNEFFSMGAQLPPNVARDKAKSDHKKSTFASFTALALMDLKGKLEKLSS